MLLMEAAFSNAFHVAKKRVVFDVVHVCHTKTCMLPYTLGAVTCRVKATCLVPTRFPKRARFLKRSCVRIVQVYTIPYLIPSRSLSLTKQPDTLTGGGSSSANNLLMKVGGVTCRVKAACSDSF